MIKKTVNQTIPVTIYVAEDGHEFQTERECEKYEKSSKLRQEWESQKVGLIGEEKIWNFYYIVSHEKLISLIDYLVLAENVWINRWEYSEILKEKDKYVGHWITYNYDDFGDTPSFTLYTLEEREEMAKETLTYITDELNFYAMLKG